MDVVGKWGPNVSWLRMAVDVCKVFRLAERSLLTGWEWMCRVTCCQWNTPNKLDAITLDANAFIVCILAGVTILLSLTVFLNMVAETMPATSDAVPLLGKYHDAHPPNWIPGIFSAAPIVIRRPHRCVEIRSLRHRITAILIYIMSIHFFFGLYFLFNGRWRYHKIKNSLILADTIKQIGSVTYNILANEFSEQRPILHLELESTYKKFRLANREEKSTDYFMWMHYYNQILFPECISVLLHNIWNLSNTNLKIYVLAFMISLTLNNCKTNNPDTLRPTHKRTDYITNTRAVCYGIWRVSCLAAMSSDASSSWICCHRIVRVGRRNCVDVAADRRIARWRCANASDVFPLDQLLERSNRIRANTTQRENVRLRSYIDFFVLLLAHQTVLSPFATTTHKTPGPSCINPGVDELWMRK